VPPVDFEYRLGGVGCAVGDLDSSDAAGNQSIHGSDSRDG
jgi:hypothetical protein